MAPRPCWEGSIGDSFREGREGNELWLVAYVSGDFISTDLETPYSVDSKTHIPPHHFNISEIGR